MRDVKMVAHHHAPLWNPTMAILFRDADHTRPDLLVISGRDPKTRPNDRRSFYTNMLVEMLTKKFELQSENFAYAQSGGPNGILLPDTVGENIIARSSCVEQYLARTSTSTGLYGVITRAPCTNSKHDVVMPCCNWFPMWAEKNGHVFV